MPPVEVITGLGEAEYVGDLTAGDQSGGAPEGFSCGEVRAILITLYLLWYAYYGYTLCLLWLYLLWLLVWRGAWS